MVIFILPMTNWNKSPGQALSLWLAPSGEAFSGISFFQRRKRRGIKPNAAQ